jgi:CheY-like chemotaxis protein
MKRRNEAVEQYKVERPDIILMDIQMPNKKRIWSYPWHQSVISGPILLL